MAIRYSGDVEMRCELLYGETYRVRVKFPDKGRLFKTVLTLRCPVIGEEPGSPAVYDVAARAVALSIRRHRPDAPFEYGMKGRNRGNPSLVIRRVYQAPCPTTAWTYRPKRRA